MSTTTTPMTYTGEQVASATELLAVAINELPPGLAVSAMLTYLGLIYKPTIQADELSKFVYEASQFLVMRLVNDEKVS